MDQIEQAIQIALDAHQGQKDKANAPYILHPLRVMLKMKDAAGMLTAILHDVLEDSNYTAEDLLKQGMPDMVVDAVRCLSKDRNQPYESYLKRVKENEVARAVKIADIEDNMDMNRLAEVTPKDLERIAKYKKAWKYLQKK